ncbi:MAG: hypothetical protein IT160_07095 [Bryobacterales bacterium]|nr:hypothetical protein [Bryobacterales bacterium]
MPAIAKRVRTKRLINPERKVSGAKPARRNPVSEIAVLGYLNPERRKPTVKKKQQKKRVSKRNPVTAAPRPKQKVSKSHRRRNPARNNVTSMLSKPIDLLKDGATAAAGFLATRQVPQMVLGARNSGFIGYLANVLAAAGTSALARKVLGNREGDIVLIGGSLYLFNRVLNDYTPLGRQLNLSGVGDPAATLKGFRPAYFPVPVVSNPRTGQPIMPAALTAHVQSLIPPTPKATAQEPAGNVGRFASRF